MGANVFAGYGVAENICPPDSVSKGYALAVCHHVSYWSVLELKNDALYAEYNRMVLHNPHYTV